MKKQICLKILSVLVVFVFFITLSCDVIAASEADKKELQNQIDKAKSELSDISDNKDDAESELDKINSQVEDVQNEIASLKTQISDLNSQIEAKQSEIAAEEKEIEAKNELLKQRMVALYEAGDTSYLDVLFNSEDLIDFISGYSAIQTILEADTKLINDLEAKKEQLEADQKSLEESKQKVEDLKNTQEIKNATLVSLQASKQAEVDKLSAEEKEKQSEIEKYNAAMVRVNQELEEAYKKAQDQIKNNTGNSGNSSGEDGLQFDGSFIWPCNNKIVTSTVKRRWGRWHKGIDIAASYESVYASASGYAYNAYDKNGYGTYIMVFHGSGYVSLYGHLSSSHVSNGQYVKQGQVIATSGNSGGSTGAHLHFELRQATSVSQFFSKSPLNPLDYLPGGYTLAAGATTES